MNIEKEKIEEIFNDAADLNSAEIVDIEIETREGNIYTRLFIDTANSVSINLCAKIGRDINRMLEEEESNTDNVYIEVSSPGLNRPLVKEKDFLRNIARPISIKYKEIDDTILKTDGDILDVIDGSLLLLTKETKVTIPLDKIIKAKHKIII